MAEKGMLVCDHLNMLRDFTLTCNNCPRFKPICDIHCMLLLVTQIYGPAKTRGEASATFELTHNMEDD
jgi:hypothetical protein